jgi:hypothetical protein
LSEKTDSIGENLDVICRTFSGIIRKNGLIKFKRFNRLHNPVGISKGYPKDMQRMEQKRVEENRIDKKRVERILHTFFSLQGWDTLMAKNEKIKKEMLGGRHRKAAITLLNTLDDDDLARRTLNLMSMKAKDGDFSWTIETVLKHLPVLVKDLTGEVDYFKDKQEKKIEDYFKGGGV